MEATIIISALSCVVTWIVAHIYYKQTNKQTRKEMESFFGRVFSSFEKIESSIKQVENRLPADHKTDLNAIRQDVSNTRAAVKDFSVVRGFSEGFSDGFG